MKIAILNWRDLKHSQAGGAEVFVHEVAKVWTEMGHEVEVFSSEVPGRSRVEHLEGVAIKRVGHLRRGTHHLMSPRVATVSKPDVILESINTFPYQLPLRRGELPPFVSLVHQMARDVWHAHLPFPLAVIAGRIEPSLYRAYRNRPLLVVSDSTKSDLQAAGLNNVSVVPQGGIGPQPLVDKEPAPTFIFVGRLTANKRPDHAIEAFRRIKTEIADAKLWVVGEGHMRSSLARDLPSGVELLGRLPRERLLQYMGRAHVLLATSVREGWGLVVTEANSKGTPAVAYDVPGRCDSVKHDETGILTLASPDALARASVTLILDKERLLRLSLAATQWGSSYGWSKTAVTLLEALCSRVPSIDSVSERTR